MLLLFYHLKKIKYINKFLFCGVLMCNAVLIRSVIMTTFKKEHNNNNNNSSRELYCLNSEITQLNSRRKKKKRA